MALVYVSRCAPDAVCTRPTIVCALVSNARQEKNDTEMEAEENIKSLVELHAKQTQDLESSFQHKMMIEVFCRSIRGVGCALLAQGAICAVPALPVAALISSTPAMTLGPLFDPEYSYWYPPVTLERYREY